MTGTARRCGMDAGTIGGMERVPDIEFRARSPGQPVALCPGAVLRVVGTIETRGSGRRMAVEGYLEVKGRAPEADRPTSETMPDGDCYVGLSVTRPRMEESAPDTEAID